MTTGNDRGDSTNIGDEVWSLVRLMNDGTRDTLIEMLDCKDSGKASKLRERVHEMEVPLVTRFIDFMIDDRFSTVVTPAAKAVMVDQIISSSEDSQETNWASTLIELVCTLNDLRNWNTSAVATQSQEEAVLRLTNALLVTYQTADDLVVYYHDEALRAYAYRIRDLSIIELASEYPQQWEQIARLILENGLRAPEQIKMVLDGTVPPALASGIL